MDQAMALREARKNRMLWKTSKNRPMPAPKNPVRVMAVSSGKGGVGKTNMVLNLAIALDQLGKNVLILDADLGLANIDVLLGLTPRYNIAHVINGSKRLDEILVQGPGEIRIMPASSGVQELTKLSDEQKLHFLEALDELESTLDVLLIDTAAGISDTVLYFILAAHEKIVVVTPEPTSLTDAYAMIKVLYTQYSERHFKILANGVRDENSGKAIFANIAKVADHFLDGMSLDYLGCVPYDPNIHKSVMKQQPLLYSFPNSPAATAITELARRIDRSPAHINGGNIQFFWKRLLAV